MGALQVEALDIPALIESLAIVFGGMWAYFIFVSRREGHPRIEFEGKRKRVRAQQSTS